MKKILILLTFLLGVTNAQAKEYSDQEICQAIYWAEGGEKTKYPYGIKSVKCEGKFQCRSICERTVRNNRLRMGRLLIPNNPRTDFITFLSGRFAPTSGDVTPTERTLNQNWTKNVKWFLEHPKEIK